MHSGWTQLYVTGVGADGTTTPERSYPFIVRDPNVFVFSGYNEYTPRGGVGAIARFSFFTEISEVTTYEYRLNDGSWTSVPRTPDALATEVSLTMDRNGPNLFSIRGRTDAGVYTPQTDYAFLVGTAPLVTSADYPDGVWPAAPHAGTFTFTQGSPGIVEFEYRIDGGEAVLVAAVAGVATAAYTPPTAGQHSLTVPSRDTAGFWSDLTNYGILVNFG